MGKTNFTKRSLEKLPAKDKRYNVLDAQTRGLGLCVYPTGQKTFYHVAKVLGYPRRTTIGQFPDMSIEAARGKASGLNEKLADWKGKDFQGPAPFEKQLGEPTFGALVDAYIEKHLRQHAKRPERAEKYLKYTVNAHLASWKNRKIGTIRRPDVLKVHAELGQDRKFAANAVIEIVRRLFNFAKTEEWSGNNPAEKLNRFHEPSRTRFLDSEELPRLLSALREESNSDLRDFVLLALFTGARKDDILSMRWENVSLPDNRWEVPEPKNSEPYFIPLTPEVVEILMQRQARKSDGPYVFPSSAGTGHVINLKRAWKRLLKRAKLEDFRMHDLRRTLGSWQAAAGTSLSIIGKSLGHSSTSATKVYARLNLDPIRESVMGATRAMIAASKKKKPRLLRVSGAGAP
ncbi:MAG: site-specific integrase [Candidatus Acidiferrales bacterium]